MNNISPIIVEVNNHIIEILNSNNPIFGEKKVYLKELLKKHLQCIKNNSIITYKSLEEIEDIKQYRTKYIHTSMEIMNDETYIKVYTNMCSVKTTIMSLVLVYTYSDFSD
jgi:hypothetical protein